MTPLPLKTYGYKPYSPSTTDPLFMKEGSDYYFYHNDHLGTPQKMTAVNGTVVWSATYSSLGKAYIDTETVENNLRLPDQYFDEETGLHYNLFRYYDPITGRYLRVDPLGMLGGDTNFYAYVWNDSVNWLDPSGLIPIDTIADIAFIGLDIWNVFTDKCNRMAHLKALGLDLLGLVLPYATGLGKAYLASKVLKKGVCFVEGTQVETSEGMQSIEDIRVGDWVLSRGEDTGELLLKRVTNTFVTPAQQVLELEVEDEDGNTETFGVTSEHPFWVKARGWVGAGKLLPGDEIFTSSGGWLRVAGSTWLSGRQTVYNIEVEDTHTYFVGEFGAWVHNMCAMDKVNDLSKASKKGKKFDEARREAFEKAGMTDPDKVKITKYDETTGTAVEFKGEGGAKVGYDAPHDTPGAHHDTQHISWQSSGKRGKGGERGNIPYTGPRHPSRSGRK